MALLEIEQDPFQIVDQISECDQLQVPNGCVTHQHGSSLHYHTPVGEENGKSTTTQYRYEPSFSYRDEGSLTPRKHIANPTIELAETDISHENIEPSEKTAGLDAPVDVSQEHSTAYYSRSPRDNGKRGITRYVADASGRCGSDEKIDDVMSLEQKLEESDDDTIPRRLAKHVLRSYKSSMDGPRLTSSGFREPKGFFMTQVMINLHVAVLRDMMKLMPPQRGKASIDMGCKETIVYICRSLEMPGVSSVSGAQFLKMTLENKIYVVLSIARPFIETYWNDYDDSIYAECHRQLDIQAKFCVKSLYNNKQKCCIFM